MDNHGFRFEHSLKTLSKKLMELSKDNKKGAEHTEPLWVLLLDAFVQILPAAIGREDRMSISKAGFVPYPVALLNSLIQHTSVPDLERFDGHALLRVHQKKAKTQKSRRFEALA